MDINLFALSGVLIAVSSGIMAFVMFTVGRSPLHRMWGFFCVSVFIWGMGCYLIGTTSDEAQADWWWRISHIGIAFIPTIFLHFVYTFLGYKRDYTLYLFYVIAIAFGVMSITSDLLIAHMRLVFGEFYYDSPPGLLYPLFTTYFFGLTIYSHYILYRSYRLDKNVLSAAAAIQHTRIRYFFLGMLISFAGGSMSYLPVYGIDIYPITNFAVTIYPIIIGYAILKHQLFDIRVAAAQGLTFLLWIFVGTRFALSVDEREAIINGLLFVAVAISGVFLVRSVNKEIRARERIENLAHELELANDQLREMDRQKTEFVSIASHQLRSPLTAIKGYASMLLEGSYGRLTKDSKEAVRRIFDSSALMTTSVDDFLNVSRIEQGRMKYDFKPMDVAKLTADTVEELKPIATERKLKLQGPMADTPIMISGDIGKLKQVFSNLIDNAIKYTPEGQISVSLTIAGNPDEHVRIEISDTGVGMSKKTTKEIFDKFVRAKNANNVNVTGTGLGLYVAKEFIKAHKGKIWGESDGEGKGSRFIVELPLINNSK